LLSGSRDIELVMIGGYIYPKTGVALGPFATATLEGLHVRHLIMGVAGLTERGLFNGNLLLVETEHAMMRCAEETTVVADHTKFGQPGLAFLSDWSPIRRVVTDSRISPSHRELVGKNVELVTASAGGSP
jgi:DeoR/GlpR family transcriptional regulator of sugar metabolism